MNKLSRRYFSLLFLCAFILPYISEGYHTFNHASDFHCRQQTETHLHELEHHCNLCDLSFSLLDRSFAFFDFNVIVSKVKTLTDFSETNFVSLFFQIIFQRGPPSK